MDFNQCADISEMIYFATHPEEQEELQFDCLFLLDLVPSERDWIFELMRTK